MTDTIPAIRRFTPTERICRASNAVAAARVLRDPDGVRDAKRNLQTAVDAGRDAGLTWGCIGDAIGIRRGLAYQRYRTRAAASGDVLA